MKIGYIQFDVQHDRALNLHKIETGLSRMQCDVIVLPELCTCGYLFENRAALEKTAEPVPDGESVRRMAELSGRFQCTIVFGMAEKEQEQIYNTAVLVSHGAYIGRYRKFHLSDFEKKFFDAGTENKVFEVNGIRIGIQICFDLWFPEISREQILMGADLLCVPANFGGESTYRIAQIRAMENLTPLVLCNRVGTEQNAEMDAYFLGKSSIVSADGNRQKTAPADKEAADIQETELPVKRANVICSDFMAEIARHTAK